MTLLESVPIAIFCLAMVFAVLVSLFFIIKIFSFGIGIVGGGKTSGGDYPSSKPAPVSDEKGNLTSEGIKLENVDEQTAAIIMAIVSHESEIPLSELRFNSIKAL